MLLTLFLCALVFAQQEPQKATTPPAGSAGKNGRMQGMMKGRGGPGAMGGFLKLTDEQRAKMQELRLAHQKEMISLRADLQKLRANMKLEITADKFNEGKVKSIQADISKVMNDIGSKMILHLRSVRDLLTPDQRKQFDARVLAGGMMRHGGRMHGGRMGPGRMMQRGGKWAPGRGMGMHQGMPGMQGE